MCVHFAIDESGAGDCRQVIHIEILPKPSVERPGILYKWDGVDGPALILKALHHELMIDPPIPVLDRVGRALDRDRAADSQLWPTVVDAGRRQRGKASPAIAVRDGRPLKKER